ncbi:MAG: nitroreductase family protein [Eubacteriales bacterium]|nr:nitroreductase family protein [Eubacteriales bacterium]
MEKTFWQAVAGRRSIYALDDEKIVSEQKIEETLQNALRFVPSAFDSRTTRMVLLLGRHHQKLWDFVLEALRKVTDDAQYEQSVQKVSQSFASGYGTVLFFEDARVVDDMAREFTLYADRFPVWSQHTSAMHQFTVWTALEAEGLGASLQHYNPLIDEAVAREWGIPTSWKLIAQMPFGAPAGQPGEKDPDDAQKRLMVFR